ncbi:MAG: peptidoglycan bridge formation glycyltransferase FemA/FemB family protein [Roseiflexaceae bacterium]|nr:peptidoglycan bridge formation glycyltransferase FemA/FemB family protein [Roseiflexaceae bacterium]
MSGSYALISPEREAWDAFVQAHPHGHPLQSAAWAALKGAFGWFPQLLAVVGPHGICAGAMLLTRSRFGLSAIYTPRGPLFSGDPHVDQILLDGIVRIAQAARAVFLRIEPNIREDAPESGVLHSFLLLHSFQPTNPIQPRSSVHLDLTTEPDRLLAGMSKGHRADVRRSAREGVTIRHGQDSETLAEFYTILEGTSQRNQFGIHTHSYYQAVCREFGDAAQIWIAERAGVAEATALTVGWGREALYLYSGSTEAGLRSGAQHAIQWAVIQWARQRGCARYDFWGVPDEFGQAAQEPDAIERARLEEQAKTDPLYGVYRFKKGFGGQTVRYLPAYDRVLIPLLYTIWRRRMAM